MFNSNHLTQAAAPDVPLRNQGIINPTLSGRLQDFNGMTFLQQAITVGITLLLIVGGVIFFFMLLIGGVQWITSSGDKAAVEAARGRIMHALIGIFVLFAVFAIVNLIGSLFGLNLLRITIPTL
jgi:hypothetical protein